MGIGPLLNRAPLFWTQTAGAVYGLVAIMGFVLLSGVAGFGATVISRTEVAVTGTVTDDAGAPIARAAVHVRDDQSGEILSEIVLTNDLGRYSTSVNVATSVDGAGVPTDYWVDRVSPNPISANSDLEIRYTTPGNVKVDPVLEVYDILGRRVHLPTDLAAGVYFYRLIFDGQNISATREFVIVGGGNVEARLEQQFALRGRASSGERGLSKTAERTGLRVTVEKSGFVTEATVRQVSNEVQIEVDFSLDAAPEPSASFAFSGTLKEGAVVTFDGSASTASTGEELAFQWDFGTGAKATGQKVGYVFGEAGTYTVKLIATGEFGATAEMAQEVTIAAGPAPTGSATVSVLVYDPLAVPLQDAAVTVEGESQPASLTDRVGLASVQAPAGVQVSLRIERDGYASQSVQLLTDEGQSPALVRVAMQPRSQPTILENAQNGGSVGGEDGARVALPFDALVDADGNPVDGDVQISLTSLDVISDEIEAFPGQFRGVTPDGSDSLIVSFGVTEFSLSQNGQELQLADGKQADIEIPVYSSRPTLGEEIPLWSVDESTGKWIQEGAGTVVESSTSPTGLAMRATVGHFSWYNIDVLGCGRSSDTGTSSSAVVFCRDEETGQPIPCWAKVRVTDEGASPGGLVPRHGLGFLLCGGWSTQIKAWADISGLGKAVGSNSYRVGSVELDPLPSGDTVEVVVSLAPLDIGQAVAINYGDIINGRIDGDEVDRYAIQGTAGDLVRLGITERTSGNLDGMFRFIDPAGNVLEEYSFFDRVSYRFETLSTDGEYLAEVMRQPLENDGPYRLQISKYAPTDSVLELNSRVEEFVWPGKVANWQFSNSQQGTVQVRAQTYFSTQDSVFSNLLGQVTLVGPSGQEIVSDEFNRIQALFNLDLPPGDHLVEVAGQRGSDAGEYHLDIEEIVLENGIRQLAYGDSAVWVFDEKPGGTKQYQFDAAAGDVFRMDGYDTYQRRSVIYDSYLMNADGDTLDVEENRRRIVYRAPEAGRYTLSIDGRFNSGTTDKADFAITLLEVTSPEPTPLSVGSGLSQQSWDGVVGVNRYTFDGTPGDSLEVVVSGSFGGVRGTAYIFAPDGSLIGKDGFIRASGSFSRAEIPFDPPLAGQYDLIVASTNRYEESFNQFSVTLRDPTQ